MGVKSLERRGKEGWRDRCLRMIMILKEKKSRQVWSNNILHVFTLMSSNQPGFTQKEPTLHCPQFRFVFLSSTYVKSAFPKP